jgi:hypothetical protein
VTMRILVLSESLPTDEAPASGRFIWRHTLALGLWAQRSCPITSAP